MEAILAEVASGETALAAAIGAGVVAGAKGVQLFVGHVRGRNGNGKPGCTAACIEHLTRLGVLETDVKYIREDVKEIKGKLDDALKAKR